MTFTYVGKILAASEIAEVVWLDSRDVDKISLVDKIIFKKLKEEGKIG